MRIINFCKKAVIAAVTVIMCLIAYGYYAVPDMITTFGEDKIEFSGIYSVKINEGHLQKYEREESEVADRESQVKLFNKIPVKTANAVFTKRKYVVPSGEIIGLRMFSKGVLIISAEGIETAEGKVNPSEKSKLKSGDLIVSVDGKEVKSASELSRLISESAGKTLSVVYVRDEKEYSTYFTPVKALDGSFKAGWWIRDSAAGIGTMTYYEKDTGVYGGLGHGICDVDTSQLLPLYYGDIVEAEISGCYKGTKGKAGELCGSFSSGKTGTIYENSEKGVYGVLESADKNGKEIPVATKTEVVTGKAKILCTTDKEGVKEYEIEIEKLDMKDNSSRNLVIKITDSALLSKTGGIVQGMSGSPIIQNGMLVGAVTHVLVNDPTKGYGIFIEAMLEEAAN